MPESSTPTISSARGTAPSHAVVAPRKSIKIVSTCTIRRTPEDVYGFWRRVSNLAQVVRHPVSVSELSATESEWVVAGPPGAKSASWNAVVITDRPNETLAWRSRDGAVVPNAGSVHFTPAPGDEGTEVKVEIRYESPAGRAGAWLAKVTGRDPARQVDSALRRLKSLLEAGEIPTTAGQPKGRAHPGREGIPA